MFSPMQPQHYQSIRKLIHHTKRHHAKPQFTERTRLFLTHESPF